MFALYSAWYFWIPKILGLDYNKSWGKVHFWILFIGVNVTFFPQHFLGLQGMPRRISDYPDSFAGWNLISSFGSLISVIATWLFLYVVYMQLTMGISTSRYPWLNPEFYSDILRALLVRSYESLEWGLSSPPKPHAFVSLPLQSNLRFKPWGKIKNNLTQKRGITTTTTAVVAGYAFSTPIFAFLLSLMWYACIRTALPLHVGGVPENIVTLRDHIAYLDLLEVIRHSWQYHLDFIERFESIAVNSFIEQHGQAAYDHMEGVYVLLQDRLGQGLDIEEAMQSLDALINELEEAIRLEDDTFVNPWSSSEWENDEELNHEAIRRYMSYFNLRVISDTI